MRKPYIFEYSKTLSLSVLSLGNTSSCMTKSIEESDPNFKSNINGSTGLNEGDVPQPGDPDLIVI